MSTAQEIKAEAISLGFDLVGVTDASPVSEEHVRFFAEWLKAGYAGQMDYLGAVLRSVLIRAGCCLGRGR